MADRQQEGELLAMLGRLNSIVEERLAATHELIECIREAVSEHSQQVVVLRESIDEFRELIEWAVRNDRLNPVGPGCTPAQGESDVKCNVEMPAVDGAVAMPAPAGPDGQAAAAMQRELF